MQENRVAQPSLDDALAALSTHFGYQSFRPGQEQVIRALLDGHDAMAVMPTGAGKSVCYQVPAVVFGGLTLVISPLISLMADQVRALKEAGIRGSFYNSTLKPRVRPEVLRRALAGWYDLMYVAPERLADPEFRAFAAQANIPLVAVDEAHCVSQWGQDFRPAYCEIEDFVESLPVRPRVAALTATATGRVQYDVRTLLGLHDPVVVVSGFDRPNLKLASFELTPKKREHWVEVYVQAHPYDTGIVYATTRKKVDQIAGQLAEVGVRVAAYHAGMTDSERTAAQQAFVNDDVQVLVATNAFGMGIDKSNVRYVINCGLPQTLEEYYQEAGRAGRDGEPAECFLLWSRGDIRTCHYFIDNTEFAEDVPVAQQQMLIERRKRLLGEMIGYAMSTSCLRARVLRYFGQRMMVPEGGCGGCSVCTGETAGRYLQLSKRSTTKDEGHIYGSGENGYGAAGTPFDVVDANVWPTKALKAAIEELASDKCDGILSGDASASLTENHAQKDASLDAFSTRSAPIVDKQTLPESSSNEAADEELFQRLRVLRKSLADEAKVPPYVVFSDRTLRAMIQRRPRTEEQLLEVSGVGPVKFKRYGQAFLKELQR